MPTGGILTFNDVVQAGQQGVQFRQQQQARQQQQQDMQRQRQRQEQEQAREDQQRARLEAANQRAAQVIEQSKAEWARNGAQGEYRPNNSTLLQAAEARGMALAEAGDWDGFMKNEVAVQPQRMRVRQGALQQFEVDGDVDKLARAVYPTVFDGKQIVGSELVKGGQASLKGAPSGPDRWRFKLSDGSVQMVDPIKLVGDLKRMSDPEIAKQEVMLNFERAKRDIQTKGQQDVERTRGEEDRKTITLRGQNSLNEIGARNEGAADRTQTRVDGQIRVAEMRRAAGGGARSGGGSSAASSVQSRFTNDRGEVVLVLRDGSHKALVGDDGRPVKSLDYEKLVGTVARDIGKSNEAIGNTPEQNRAAARRTLGSEAKPAGAPAGNADDLRKLWGGGTK